MGSREEKLESGGMLTLCLQSFSEDDPFFARKKRLSHTRDLKFNFQVPIPLSLEEANQLLDEMLGTARVVYMNEVELYFSGGDDFGPISPRNELESLNTIFAVVNSLLASARSDTIEALQVLQNRTDAMIRSIGDLYIDDMVSEKADTHAEGLLLEWGKIHGVRTRLKIAYFEGLGRGAVASENINIGDTALEIPESLMISEDLIYDSEMLMSYGDLHYSLRYQKTTDSKLHDICGQYGVTGPSNKTIVDRLQARLSREEGWEKFDVLKNLDGITTETMLLLWSMRERYNSNSKFKIYFETLPEEFRTGLSFGIDALSVLEGTLLFEEILQAREHLREQYDAVCPALYSSYPGIFQKELYTWEKFLWACELWYSNSMKVVFSDGKLRTCLVPIAGLLNHSVCAHIMHYGRVDSATKSLKFNLSRPCNVGDQCYLSYGSFAGSHLITFYGFLPKGDNPYDVIPIDIDDSPAEDGSSRHTCGTGWTTHMVRGTWLSKSNKPPTYGLPPPLMTTLRAVLKVDDIEDNELPPEVCGQDKIKESDRALLETLESIFNPMMEGLTHSDDSNGENSSWDVKLALDYRHLQRRIISSILDSCATGIRMLDDL